jgi:hypothetical protein
VASRTRSGGSPCSTDGRPAEQTNKRIGARRDGRRRVSVPIGIEREEVQRLLKSGAKLVDVLPAREYARQHLAGAISIPLKQLDQETTASLRRDVPVIVYCYDTV